MEGYLLIVRVREKHFVMIEQHHHAQLAGKLFLQLHDELLPSKRWREDIFYAIREHDCGWIHFDEEPFWNDEKNIPYDFNEFPIGPKIVLYEYGINRVEKSSPYAALLCSKHYVSFIRKRQDETSKQFVKRELLRQKRVQEKLNLHDGVIEMHYHYLKLFDDLSLYICLNEPGTTKEDEHFFFKNGITLPPKFGENKLQLFWENKSDVMINKNLFKGDVTLFVKQKVIDKDTIAKLGIKKAYVQASEDIVPITIKYGQ